MPRSPAFDWSDATIYLKTSRGAPRYRVIAVSLKAPDLTGAVEIVPESRGVVEDLLVAGENLLVRELDGGVGIAATLAPAGRVSRCRCR